MFKALTRTECPLHGRCAECRQFRFTPQKGFNIFSARKEISHGVLLLWPRQWRRGSCRKRWLWLNTISSGRTLYNVLEFLGGLDAVVKKKWASRKQVSKCWRTANHHRHLGSPNKYPLPADPPSLNEAISLVLDLLKKWISEQFSP